MNLTLYRILPFDSAVRPLYVLAPDPVKAATDAAYLMPGGILSIEAVANNAYQGDTFPRFISWEAPSQYCSKESK
jgi:hypothetical protein